MRSSLSHNLSLILLLCTGLSLAAASQPKGNIPGQGSFKTTVFDSSFVKALYKGTFDISKNHLSGLFLIKRTEPNSIRIVFFNEIGMKFFDFEFMNDTFKVHYCYPSLERRSLLKLLEKDFRLLMVPDATVKRMKPGSSKDPELAVFGVKSSRGSFVYTYDRGSGRILGIRTSGSVIGKTDLRLYGDVRFFPASILLSNPTIRLQIKMNFLSN